MTDFMTRLRTATTRAPDTPLLVLGNFEVENVWARGEPGLPAVPFSPSRDLVDRMAGFGILLAGPGDHVVVTAEPDQDYLDHLAGLGVGLPTVLVCADHRQGDTISDSVLRDAELLDRVRDLGRQGVHLLPHGVSTVEEDIAERSGMPLAAAGAAVCKRVNSKIYSRSLATRHGLRQPTGWTCRTRAEWNEAVEGARKLLALDRTVVVKDAFGVSGKGMVRVADERRLDRLDHKIATRLRDSGRVALVVEEWIDRRGDLNYQFTVNRDGVVRFDFVKELITNGGVHGGHRMPARLSDDDLDVLETTAMLLGRQLSADGYFGVVGMDAMIDATGRLHPVVEINARHNMSTYQARLHDELIEPGQVVLAKHYPLDATTPGTFDAFRRALGTLLYRPGHCGLLVNNFATVDTGRVYGLVVAEDQRALDALDAELSARITTVGAA
jgi:hypothetical protein